MAYFHNTSYNPGRYVQITPFHSSKHPQYLVRSVWPTAITTPTDADLLGNKLKAAGVTYELVVYPNEEHGFTTITMNTSILKVISLLNVNVP
jgi:hypothetical protein